MPYPSHLLPRKEYKYLEDILRGGFLVRYTQDKDIVDEAGQVKSSHVCTPRTNCENLSVSLFGIYQEEDVMYCMVGDRSAFFQERWIVGESVPHPADKDYEERRERGFFYLSIDDIHNHTITYEKNNEQHDLICSIVHCPTNCNFWHFEVKWRNEDGFIQPQSGNWKKRVLNKIRNIISEFGQTGSPPAVDISESLYIRKH